MLLDMRIPLIYLFAFGSCVREKHAMALQLIFMESCLPPTNCFPKQNGKIKSQQHGRNINWIYAASNGNLLSQTR